MTGPPGPVIRRPTVPSVRGCDPRLRQVRKGRGTCRSASTSLSPTPRGCVDCDHPSDGIDTTGGGRRYGPRMQGDELAARIYAAAHLRGTFTLRSGVVSDEYFDKYRFEADPALLRAIAEAMAALVGDDVDALAGLELGGVPLATMLSQVTGLPARFVRKQAKTYGTCQLAEGGDLEGLRLLIVEDVITSGGAVLDAARELRGGGAKCDRVVCVIDREAGGGEKLAVEGLHLDALFTMSELKDAAN
jgi:orotate phosphoribosyltransferase